MNSQEALLTAASRSNWQKKSFGNRKSSTSGKCLEISSEVNPVQTYGFSQTPALHTSISWGMVELALVTSPSLGLLLPKRISLIVLTRAQILTHSPAFTRRREQEPNTLLFTLFESFVPQSSHGMYQKRSN